MEELFNKAKSGDIEAFSKLISSIEKDLERFASSKLTDKSYVNDVIQNVYYKAYMKLNTLNNEDKFRSWMFTILKNECINTNKTIARRKEVSLSGFGDILEDYSNYNPESKISFEQMISNLTDEEKHLLKMKYEENLSTKEISEELNIPYNTVKSKIRRAIKKITLIVLILMLFSGFTVLATFIIKQIKAYFTTSLNAINTAVENNYVQEIDSDFVYDNGIGVKIDAIVLDDKNLDISFVYDVLDKEKYGDITGIKLEDFVIKNENDVILFDSQKNSSENNIKYFRQDFYNFDKNDDIFRNSILFSKITDSFPIINDIKFEIESININNKKYIINGNWELESKVFKKFNKRNKETYSIVENQYVKEAQAVLIDTSIQFDIDFNVKLSHYDINKIILKNDNNSFSWIRNIFREERNNLNIYFDLGQYTDNIDELTLEIPRENEKNILIKFRRDQ